MKKALLFAAVTMMSASAMASKARVSALGASGAQTLPATSLGAGVTGVTTLGAQTVAYDIQDSFDNPARMFEVGDLLTIEYGAGTAATREGGVFRTNGDWKYGVYLGHRSPVMTVLSTGLAGSLAEQNPLEIFFGMKGSGLRWAASIIYADAKSTPTTAGSLKVNEMGARLGVMTDAWNAYAHVGLAGSTELANGDKAKADMGFRVGGLYSLESVYLYADYQTGGGKVTVGTTDTKMSGNLMTLGAESKVKGDTAHFFYGAKYQSYEQKVGDNQKATSAKLPVYAGVEVDAASWLTLRGSFAQSVLVNSAKVVNNAGTTTTDTAGLDDATAALGAGLKFGKAVVDGTLKATTTGNLGLDAAGLMSEVSLTYNF